MKKKINWAHLADDVGMFVLTAVCVYLSGSLDDFRAGKDVTIALSVGRLILAGLLALLLTAAFEWRGLFMVKDPEQRRQVKKGRAKNRWFRIIVAILSGFFWPRFVDMILGFFGIGKA